VLRQSPPRPVDRIAADDQHPVRSRHRRLQPLGIFEVGLSNNHAPRRQIRQLLRLARPGHNFAFSLLQEKLHHPPAEMPGSSSHK